MHYRLRQSRAAHCCGVARVGGRDEWLDLDFTLEGMSKMAIVLLYNCSIWLFLLEHDGQWLERCIIL